MSTDRFNVDVAVGSAEDWLEDIALLIDDLPTMKEQDIILAKQDGLEILDEIRLHLNTIERYLDNYEQ